ncbi:TetR/AcrR family transcriptional regulator [Chitiniphilus eburneus]|uniref:TetR/AcrR family transcriptional regulator n=1 Tax=Chitiniphilus eburneus TaxID=2571148 RepID=A0A4V5MNZ0_9NEIS|nr:TetR/AcrR family transcriptional regulator [Chitiniphilus eburneus]TJZ66678.1 TetR/AcrR family transcriptional regulator [Chitiniphilus eburneus]
MPSDRASPSSPTEPGRRERKRQQTLDHLADTAWALFHEHGFDAVTMEAIAARADVAKGTLYKHFPVKEALLRHRFHRDLAAGLPALLRELALLPTAAARLHAFFRHNADWSIGHREFLAHYVRFRLGEVGAADGISHSGLDRLFAELIAAGQQHGEFRRGHDATVLARNLQFLHLCALLRWLHTPALDLRAEFAAMLDLFLHGAEVPR